MKTALLILLLAFATPAWAGDNDFCADRPGIATGTCVVPGGHVQVEFSLGEYSRTHNSDGTERDWSWLPAELRIGLDQATEVNFAFAPLLRSKLTSDGVTERTHGAGDLTVGIKRRLTPADAKVVVTALPFLTLPVGSRDFTQGRVSEGMLVSLTGNVSDKWSWTLTPEAERNPDSDGPGYHWRGALAGEIAYAVSDKLNIELDALVAREREGDDHKREAQLGLAAGYQAGKNLQLDVEVDTGFARSSPDLQLITGVAVRF
ncbi:transporter [Sphingomonas sp. KRR8]|uniref:transporter n=1 Tax=Sphingomonas sp. KRR8 TaxID=2942996 RepID=UPI002021AD55|nr:transporter [Sphingomonas sp. KRR8]URD60915.1 transporter [Sphingomonas sp. KRR8]